MHGMKAYEQEKCQIFLLGFGHIHLCLYTNTSSNIRFCRLPQPLPEHILASILFLSSLCKSLLQFRQTVRILNTQLVEPISRQGINLRDV